MNASLSMKQQEIKQALQELYEELNGYEECEVEERGAVIKQIQIYESILQGLQSNLDRPLQHTLVYFDN